MRLRWTTPAADDLYRIVRRIQQDNPAAAAQVARVLHDGCGSLRDFPYRGPRGEDRRHPRTGFSRLAVHRRLSD